MARSKHHKKNMSDSEWRSNQNRKRERLKRLEARRKMEKTIRKFHNRRHNNPLTSPVVTKQSFSQRMLARLGINKSRKKNM